MLRIRTGIMVAWTCVLATIFSSCKNKIATMESLSNLDSIPTQTVENMIAWQLEGDVVRGRLMAPYMAKYTRGSDPYEIFPNTFRVEGYTVTGELETVITADKAVHKSGQESEAWEAYGHVVIQNILKEQRMETDTLYWDQRGKRIYTHCFVRMESPDFFAQGYGMESDERATNAKILRPFDSYGYIQRDTVSNQRDTLVKIEEKTLSSRPNLELE